MSKSKGAMGSYTKVAFLFLLALAAFVFSYIFLFVFVPIIVAYVWDDHDKVKRLEARLEKLDPASEETKADQT